MRSENRSEENNSFTVGLSGGIPIGLGYLSVSFAFGIFAVSSGLSVLESIMISLFNLTSAGQLAAVPIIASTGSYIELALTQLIINLRYSLMSVSLSQKLGDSVTLADRFWIAFGNTDEVFGVSSQGEGTLGKKYFLGLILPPILGWTLGTALGAFSGSILPEITVSALGIAIYAMFIAIVLPVAKKNSKAALAVAFAILLSCLFKYLPVLNKVPSGFVIIICAVTVSAVFAAIFPIEDEGEGTYE